MGWTTEELIHMILEMADVELSMGGIADHSAADRMVGFSDEDDAPTQMQGSNLSMEEVRRLFDEFEQILQA